MKEIKVSVIIYVKNTASYIEQCIRSVMKQTLREIEILIVDGGSTDGTKDIIEKIKQEDERIRIFYVFGSVGAQFNLGLKEAKGQYIAICEADDYILSDMYEKEYQIASKNQLDVIRAGYYQICNIYNKEYRFELKSCYDHELTEKVIDLQNSQMLFLEQGINGFWNGLYKRQFLLDNHIWMNETRGAAYQDISFSFLTQMYAKKIWFMKEAFYCYRIDNPNASVNSLNGVELHMKEYAELRKRLITTGYWEQYKNIFFSWELISYRCFLGMLPNSLREENAHKVYHNLKEQVKKNKYNIEKVMKTVKELAKSILYSEFDFIQTILSGLEQRDDLLDYIKSSYQKDKLIILFGIGHIGYILKQFFELSKKEIVLMDNNKFFQKNGFMGKKVYQPERLVRHFLHKKYIIASAAHVEEMKEQILKLGVSDKNILICDNEEFFLRKIFVKAGDYIER